MVVVGLPVGDERERTSGQDRHGHRCISLPFTLPYFPLAGTACRLAAWTWPTWPTLAAGPLADPAKRTHACTHACTRLALALVPLAPLPWVHSSHFWRVGGINPWRCFSLVPHLFQQFQTTTKSRHDTQGARGRR